jgi:hypothetical protein
VLATFDALATEETMNFRTVLVCVAVMSVAATSRAQYATGFESPTFVSGQVAGQDSWTTSANNATARVLTDAEIATELTNAGLTPGQTVHGGTQALMVSGSGASNATIRVIPGLEVQPIVRLDIWARPLLAGTTGASLGNIFMTMEDSASIRAAAFRFGTSFGQTIDYGTNIPSVWQPTTILWDGDTWFHLTLDVDYSTKTYNMAVNGAPVTASPIPFYKRIVDQLQSGENLSRSQPGGNGSRRLFRCGHSGARKCRAALCRSRWPRPGVAETPSVTC